jgi:hypothetical protein
MDGGRASKRRDGAQRGAHRALPAAYGFSTLVVAALVACSLAGCGLAAGLSESWAGFGSEPAKPPPAAPALVPAGATAPATATVDARRAVLARGSAPVRGVPPLGRNALAALYGAYSLPGQATTADGAAATAASMAEVWYTAEPVALSASWAIVACRGLPSGWLSYESRPRADGPPTWALKAAEYWLFVRFPAGYAAPCAFAAALADRFDWFRRYGSSVADLAFPALFELAP